ncbi:hypothetical protein EJ03DRAFT_205271 [Teratosphaeria nubilosa]|uniref:NTF2-like domain-containing protein n=1 Tax=Teratosphaeria nubilosa TaxID=161662 RepID=A0A6G1KYA5_9PEZI|nr:hypothetical protein EJ03DRAFT_205271 [Teratosphaeria nubilosa]
MRTAIIISTLAFVSAAIAGGGDNNDRPYHDSLSQSQAEEIVGKFSAVLSGHGYQGMTINQTAQSVVAQDYVEYSQSLQSLEGVPLGGPTATSYKEWYDRVTAHPTADIVTNEVLVAGDHNILWSWTFPHIGSSQYEVSGFALLRIDSEQKICQRKFEFNSLAWALDLNALKKFCSS